MNSLSQAIPEYIKSMELEYRKDEEVFQLFVVTNMVKIKMAHALYLKLALRISLPASYKVISKFDYMISVVSIISTIVLHLLTISVLHITQKLLHIFRKTFDGQKYINNYLHIH